MTYPALTDPIGPGTKAWEASDRYIRALRAKVPGLEAKQKIRIAQDYMVRELKRQSTPKETIAKWQQTCRELAQDQEYEISSEGAQQ